MKKKKGAKKEGSQDEVSLLRKDLFKSEMEVNRLEALCYDLRSEIERKDERISSLELRIKDFALERDDVLTSLREKMEDYRAQNRSLRETLSIEQALRSEVEKKNEKIRDEVLVSTENEKRSLKHENEGLKRRLEVLDTFSKNKSKMEEENKALLEGIKEARKTRTTIEEELDREFIRKSQAMKEEMDRTIEKIRENVAKQINEKLDFTVKKALKRNKELEEEMLYQSAEIDKLLRRNDFLEEEVQFLKNLK